MSARQLFDSVLATAMELLSGDCHDCQGSGERVHDWVLLPGDTWWYRPEHTETCPTCEGSGTYIAGPTDPGVSNAVLSATIWNLDFEHKPGWSMEMLSRAKDYVYQVAQAEAQAEGPPSDELQSIVGGRLIERMEGMTEFEPLLNLVEQDLRKQPQPKQAKAPSGALTEEELAELLSGT